MPSPTTHSVARRGRSRGFGVALLAAAVLGLAALAAYGLIALESAFVLLLPLACAVLGGVALGGAALPVQLNSPRAADAKVVGARPDAEDAGAQLPPTLLAPLFAQAPCALVLSDADDRILCVNSSYEKLTGYSPEQVVGQPIGFNHSAPMDSVTEQEMQRELLESGEWRGQFWLRNTRGEAFAEKVLRIQLANSGDADALLTLTLFVEMVGEDSEKRLMLWQAHHDTLTKLPNRNLFTERFNRALLNLQPGEHGALISLDLDNFKIVNDSVGAAKGDLLLTQVAFRIALCAREGDTVARLAGDCFAVLMERVDDETEVERLANELVVQMRLPFELDGRELYLSASAGVSVFHDASCESGELLQQADAARLQVKRNGGNSTAFFEPVMNARAERRLEVESMLRRAVDADQLVLHFQPVIDLRTGLVSGAEALLRWQHPTQGMISPGEFIPIAEETGIIVEIGEWVVREARRHAELVRSVHPEFRMSLNVSAAQIKQPQDLERLVSVLAQGGCEAMTLELTESALIADKEGVQRFLKEAQQLGARVSLDDFGTGFSSLSYLRDFNFDVLKVDKSFVDTLANVQDYGLVASIVSMGRILGMRTVAEGVEEADQVRRLEQIGCDYVQGFHFSKPLPFEEFLSYLEVTNNADVQDLAG